MKRNLKRRAAAIVRRNFKRKASAAMQRGLRRRASATVELFRRRSLHDELHHWLRRMRGRLAIKPPLRLANVVWFLGSATVAGGVMAALWDGALPREAVFMAGIFALAALLWSSEALPLFATALLVIGLEIILLANPGGWSGFGFEGGATPAYEVFLAPFADPIIILFLGGFLMAQAAIKEGVDKALAGGLLRVFRGEPRRVMLGLMLVTATFSMFMSNTATTAMMITLAVPMLAQIPHDDPARKGVVLAIPFAANIGGMGTPISSPPNAVAVGFLLQAGYEITFLQWMLVAVPLMAGLLLVAWLLLGALFRPKTPGLRLRPEGQALDGRGWYVVIVIVTTIALWLTDALHGLPTAVVALLPAIAFTATGLLGRRDYNTLEWHILTLIAGGIALGVGMQRTGLDQVLVQALPVQGAFALGVLVLATVLLSTLMSNTAAANLLLPIGVSLAAGGGLAGGGPGALPLGIGIALAASMAMALPVSTPPNAIAYAHGEFETRDIALAGALMGALAAVLIVLFVEPVVAFWIGG